MDGYCERHHQPWDIKCINGQWVCECSKCRAEGLLDTFVDIKTETLPEKEWTANNHTQRQPLTQINTNGGNCLADIEKVIKGLECISGDVVFCKECHYSDATGFARYDCQKECARDALELLKEQPQLVRRDL